MDDIHAHDVAAVLDREGVAIRAGHHCAMPLHRKLGLAASCRASFHVYNQLSDIEQLGEGRAAGQADLPSMSFDDLYRQNILDHYQNPRHYGTLDHPDVSAEDSNPLCGDEIRMDLMIKDGVIEDVRFSGKGCSISKAAASMLTEEIVGKTLDEVKRIGKDNVLEMLGIERGQSGSASARCLRSRR